MDEDPHQDRARRIVRVALYALAFGLVVVGSALAAVRLGYPPGLAASIATRLTCAAIAVWLVARYREWRVLFLAGMLLLMGVRQLLTLLQSPQSVGAAEGPALTLTESPGFLVSALAAASILYLGVMLSGYTRTIRTNQATIRDLERLLPICASCKKIRKKDEPALEPESWVAVEQYISEHTKVRFTHGLCPKCITHLYPELDVS